MRLRSDGVRSPSCSSGAVRAPSSRRPSTAPRLRALPHRRLRPRRRLAKGARSKRWIDARMPSTRAPSRAVAARRSRRTGQRRKRRSTTRCACARTMRARSPKKATPSCSPGRPTPRARTWKLRDGRTTRRLPRKHGSTSACSTTRPTAETPASLSRTSGSPISSTQRPARARRSPAEPSVPSPSTPRAWRRRTCRAGSRSRS